MRARGITLMALGALATTILIGLDPHGTAELAGALVAGVGALALFFAGSAVLVRGRHQRAEAHRVDVLADDTQREARVHLLAGREMELLRRIEALETRRDQVLTETDDAPDAGHGSSPARALPKPKLVAVPTPD